MAQTRATKPPIAVPAECRLSMPAVTITSLKDAPDIAAELQRQHLVLADAGEVFNPSDVTDGSVPSRQFIRAYRIGDRAILWYFHGGYVHHIHVIGFRMQRDTFETEARLHLDPINLTGDPCAATQAILDGVRNFQSSDY